MGKSLEYQMAWINQTSNNQLIPKINISLSSVQSRSKENVALQNRMKGKSSEYVVLNSEEGTLG